jgi:membrane-associated protease RseP (regulator of RpoE activity)
MLDGGQFLFILFEEVIGTPINMKLKVALFNLSYMFILALFIFVVYNDLMRIF